MAAPDGLSVIIPAWNEAPLIRDCLSNAWRIGDEVIVADGGSSDGTGEIAEEAGAEVVLAPKGRGAQLRAGADKAGGEIFLFLHADARLPAGARTAIFKTLSDPGVIGGSFFIRFLPESWFTHLLEPGNDIRRRLTRRHYGDSGIFIRAASYRELGGFEPWPLMHDYEFSGRMEKAGRCRYLREPSIYVSARRFQERELRTLFLWLRLQSLYLLGVSPHRLARSYPDIREKWADEFIEEARLRTG